MSFYIRNDEVTSTTDKEKLLSDLDNLYEDLKIQGNKNVRERERIAELYKEEKEVGAEAQELESRAKELRIGEAKKKEERAEAERSVNKSKEKIARSKEAVQEMMDIMDI